MDTATFHTRLHHVEPTERQKKIYLENPRGITDGKLGDAEALLAVFTLALQFSGTGARTVLFVDQVVHETWGLAYCKALSSKLIQARTGTNRERVFKAVQGISFAYKAPAVWDPNGSYEYVSYSVTKEFEP